MSPKDSTSRSETSRRELLRKGATATGAAAIGLAGVPGTSLAGCMGHDICPKSPGYWKHHWPGDETITIAGCTLDRSEAQSILKTPKRGNKCLIMLFQLIAAKVNLAAGAPSCTELETALSGAEAFIRENNCLDGNCNVGETRSWNGAEQYKNKLDAYNNGRLCECNVDKS
ncbi:twin-arginine translocation signal domain-containing protein [Haloarculaceae archaeon H-GB2-1]|nr:twin-arginine translocation signal domain-containing protein [Haloarculaceae archaeon H-GB1-1]MEA5386986.1 twin-arginine translocation signal domain-containing protein [Haloarculaceae archaeon H-GB11]MEA5408488.1 twin-arginine translocation signal domain-containing protein [Haloarculaceae archaeon H-GB2-1]